MSSASHRETPSYSKWVNFVSSILLSGSGHFLSGKKRAGTCWFFVVQFAYVGAILAAVTGAVTSPNGIGALFAGVFVIPVLMIIDGCRKPIPRLKPMVWGPSSANIFWARLSGFIGRRNGDVSWNES